MAFIASRDLGDRIPEVLRAVADGSSVTVTEDGVPTAEIRPIRAVRASFLTKAELIEIVSRHQADVRLAKDVGNLGDETTDN
jgi:prevent-host-death family protein